MDVSVVIVTYNSGEYITRCLESIYKQTKKNIFELIIVDNASSDSTVSIVKQHFPKANIIKNEANKGFGAANNQGAKIAKGRFILFLNPDTELISDAISIFLSTCNLQPATCLGGRQVNSSGKDAFSFGNFPSILQLIGDVGFRRLYPRYYKNKLSPACVVDFSEPQEVDYVSGAALFIRRDVFEKVDGFDESYFMYYEEVDLARRLQVAGYKLQVVPSATIVHHESLSTSNHSGFNYQKYGMLEKSKYLYFKKHYGTWIAGIAKCIQLITLLLHSPFTKQAFGKSAKITIKA